MSFRPHPWVTICLVIGACTTRPDDPRETTGSAAGSIDAGSLECTAGAERACPCGGSQSCVKGAWAPCNCPSAPPVATNPARCKAGYYTGGFSGEYWSGAFDLGFGSLVPVTINAKPVGDKPGLGMTLQEQANADVEFVTYVVRDGCLIGTAEASGTEHPIFGTITGELDCETGVFQGVLRGYYYLFGVPQITYEFEGPVSASYKPEQQRLADGKWEVKENQTGTNSPGGSGTWDVSWAGEVTDAPALPPECERLKAPDAGVMISPDAS